MWGTGDTELNPDLQISNHRFRDFYNSKFGEGHFESKYQVADKNAIAFAKPWEWERFKYGRWLIPYAVIKKTQLETVSICICGRLRDRADQMESYWLEPVILFALDPPGTFLCTPLSMPTPCVSMQFSLSSLYSCHEVNFCLHQQYQHNRFYLYPYI